jgi:hypothetical protein
MAVKVYKVNTVFYEGKYCILMVFCRRAKGFGHYIIFNHPSAKLISTRNPVKVDG